MITDPNAQGTIAIEFRDLTIANNMVRTKRQWAVEGISFATRADQKTLLFGLPESGKTTLMHAVLHPELYPGQVSVHVDLQELSLKDSRVWSPRQYATKYDPELRAGSYIVVDDAYDQAVPYLVSLERGMLALAGIDGHDCFHRFDRLLYLYEGRIHFDDTPPAFFDWVKAIRPKELALRLADYLVDSGGERPGCPGLDG